MGRYYVEPKYGTDGSWTRRRWKANLPSRRVRSYGIKDIGRAEDPGLGVQVAVLSITHPNKYNDGEMSLYYHRHHYGPSVKNKVVNGGLYRCQVSVYQDARERPLLTEMCGYKREGDRVVVVNRRNRRVRKSIPIVAWVDALACGFNAHKDHFVQPFLDLVSELPAPWNLMLESPHAFFAALLGGFTPLLPEDL